MSWRYQVINRGTENEPDFGIHEIYYDKGKEDRLSWTEDTMSIDHYETIEDLIGSLEKMLNDAKKYPPLLESDLEKDLS